MMAERETVLDFKRSVQVDGGKLMLLELEIEPEFPKGWIFGGILSLVGGRDCGAEAGVSEFAERSSATLQVACGGGALRG